MLLLGRIYLGMHSLVDIISGLAFGLAILAFWLNVHEYIDNFIVSGQNGMYISIQQTVCMHIFRFLYRKNVKILAVNFPQLKHIEGCKLV